MLSKLLSGDQKWPRDAKDRDVLYFLAQSFRAQLIKQLPPNRSKASQETLKLAFCAKALIKELADISLEIAQMTISTIDDEKFPNWFKVEIIRDLPRLIQRDF